MNILETLALALSLEINIELKPQTLKLVVTPREKITEELREAIKENRDAIICDLLYKEAVAYLARITHGKPEKTRRAAIDEFEKRTASLASPDIGIAGCESSLRSPEVIKAIVANACSRAREALVTAEEDRRLEQAGQIQSEQQVFRMAIESGLSPDSIKEKLGR